MGSSQLLPGFRAACGALGLPPIGAAIAEQDSRAAQPEDACRDEHGPLVSKVQIVLHTWVISSSYADWLPAA